MNNVSIGPLTTESGTLLLGTELVYERTGNPEGPVVLLCHALSGDARAVGNEAAPGWWAGLAGPGKAVDTEVFGVISFNVLGGSDGSTGPASINPETGEPYRTSFPELTIRDMVRAERAALRELGIDHLAAVIGGSLGGMRALEWGRLYPDMLDIIMPLAVTPSYSPYGIAFNHIGIEAIRNDPQYRDGFYDPGAVLKGLEIARMAGLVTYRSGALYEERFGRDRNARNYEVQSYLDYQGTKLAERFDPNSYITLMKAINTHDVGEAAISVPIFSVLFTNDLIYPAGPMIDWLRKMPDTGWEVIETDYGHDGFLAEYDKWTPFIRNKLNAFLPSEHPSH